MTRLYRQELIKLFKKKSTLWCGLILIGTALIFASLARVKATIFPAKALFSANFEAQQFIVFFMVAAAATMMTMEFQFGTIKQVLTQRYSRRLVLVSKWLVLLTYSLLLYVGSSLLAILLKVSLVNDKFTIFTHAKFWHGWLAGVGGDFLNTWLLLSIVLLVATLFKSSGAAVAVGIVGYFVLAMVNIPMVALIRKYAWLKWNPINMFNYSAQLGLPTISKVTKLSDVQLFWGNLGYIILFLAVGLVFFQRREV
ncbi:ABC transporter permease [Lactiplantibacillus paraplantarum]|uniref:ABC transporter permease n=1 Tax=Lactiplantibacillus paraplantarum TaxID=60520 RepID=UPI0021A8A550|nr:ABC transporter permease [Lactiplantibacillus paraplantarum]MCT4457789.1 ABC transporter permease [Lactiplantibacillus paraplantarum]WEE37414.1 ABC transporter permease [Lactiplantibacillus paraplantarum]